MHYSEDDSTTKFIVAAVWVLDTLHVSFMCHMLYYYLITNYGVPMSLEYVVWSFPASILVNSFVITIVQLFFAHKIYYLCHRKLRWLVTAPIILLVLVQSGFSMATAVVTFINDALTYAFHTRFYTATPAAAAILLAEVLNTVSLCVLLYESGSRSAVPRTKRLLNTLIIYAVNRCLLTLLVVIAEVAVDVDKIVAWTMALTFLTPKLYANSLLASLNTRQHLRSQGSSLQSDLGVNSIRFANTPKPSGDTGSSNNEVEQLDKCKVTVIDIATRGAFNQNTTLQRAAGMAKSYNVDVKQGSAHFVAVARMTYSYIAALDRHTRQCMDSKREEYIKDDNTLKEYGRW
ncbi:hypothetical protein EV401DRAFT_2201664 [Pisolithus croceorrhizus]|nr:hypothetical protein EV401DRAFT_2201664 [Pisolithus croceorrhizus]